MADPNQDPNADPDDDDEEDVGDVAGLDPNVATDEDPPTGEGQGTASEGPTEGNKAMGDAAINRFYADMSSKAKLYDRLSKVVGAFDHSAMDAKKVNAYGVKKLGIACAKGQEHVALDAYLTGIEAARKAVRAAPASAAGGTGRAQDAAQRTPEFESWLNG